MKNSVWVLAAFLLLLYCSACGAATYWVATDGNDALDGKSPATAWASPSRGTATRVTESYSAGSAIMNVASTEGFLESGHLNVDSERCVYEKKTPTSFILTKGFLREFPINTRVFDADILGGDSFEPGDIINLRGGNYKNKPLHFYKSGIQEKPITYQSAPGERAVLVSEDYKVSPVRHLGNGQGSKTEYIVLKDLIVRNSASGMHAAAGVLLNGVGGLVIDGCDVDISGTDIYGDNNAIQLYDSYGITITGCRLRSKNADGLFAVKSSNIVLTHSVIYESLIGIVAYGKNLPAHIKVDHCTFYHTNRYWAVVSESPGTIEVTNSILTEMPSMVDGEALNGPGKGDYNCLWHNAVDYGDDWNGTEKGSPGTNDIHADPKIISFDPSSQYFLRIPNDSHAANAGTDGTYMGAFPPVAIPPQPSMQEFNVRDYGAKGDGINDDTDAINKAIMAASAAGGGKVVFPATEKNYLISNSLIIDSDWIHLYGPGATLRLKDASGRNHLIDVSGAGPAESIVERITIEGLTLDGNYRNQPIGEYSGPRGLWVENAHHIIARNLLIKDTYCGLTFGPNTRNCQAIDVTVTDWNHDGFGASGRGINGGCTDVRFIRCKAVDTPKCIKGWEIEEGAQRVYLEDCHVENLHGEEAGYYVRHHEYTWSLLVDDVEFVRCSVKNITANGFIITTVPGDHIRPYIRTRNVRLIDCEADAPVTIACGVEDVRITDGRYGGTMAIGFRAEDPLTDLGLKWPVRSVTIENSDINRLVVNAQTGNPNGKAGDESYPDYQPRIRLKDVRLSNPIEIVGEKSNVIVEETTTEDINKQNIPDDAAGRKNSSVSEDQREIGPLVLVKDGAAISKIIIADDADWWQRMAAEWLKEYIWRSTGVKIPLLTEASSTTGALISVGNTKLARDAGITTDDLKWDGCKLLVKDNILFLIGRDAKGAGRDTPSDEEMKDYLEGDPWSPDRVRRTMKADIAGANGTCKAVVTFLEDICGVRWFMPFEQGILVPKQRDLVVPRSFNKTVNPVFAYSVTMFLYGSPRFSPAAYANNFRYGIRLRHYGGHSWYRWLPSSFFESHPEYFAMQNGKRTAEGNHLCTTNPEVREILLKGIRSEFDAGYEWVELGQTDGWKRCECPTCESQDNFRPWDPERDGPDWFKWLHTTNRQNPVERIHLLHNWIAEQCAISHPGKVVLMLAYIPTRWPSKKIDRYSPNVAAELCHDIPEMYDAWADKVSMKTVYKIWWDMSVSGYRPDITPKEVADEIRQFRDKGVLGIFNGGDGNNWGLNGPVFYVMGKLLGNPDLDEYKLMKEYCEGVYGEAGKEMYEFFLHIYLRPMRINRRARDNAFAEDVRTIFPPQVIQELENLLLKAEKIPVSGSAAYNLRMTRYQSDHLKLVSQMWVAYEAYLIAPNRQTLAQLKKHVDAFENFRYMILHMNKDETMHFPDWGSLCKWLTGYDYWASWDCTKVDLKSVRGNPAGYYSRISEPLTLDFKKLEKEITD